MNSDDLISLFETMALLQKMDVRHFDYLYSLLHPVTSFTYERQMWALLYEI